MIDVVLRGLELLKVENFISRDSVLSGDFPLIGANSEVDSVAFVVFVTSVEDELSATMDDITIDLSLIPQLNEKNPSLTAQEFADYLQSIS